MLTRSSTSEDGQSRIFLPMICDTPIFHSWCCVNPTMLRAESVYLSGSWSCEKPLFGTVDPGYVCRFHPQHGGIDNQVERPICPLSQRATVQKSTSNDLPMGGISP